MTFYIYLDNQLLTLSTDMTNNEIDQGMAVILCYKLKIAHFPHIFLNMDISLVNALICLEISIHIAETCSEGSVSQNFDIGLSFNFMVC